MTSDHSTTENRGQRCFRDSITSAGVGLQAGELHLATPEHMGGGRYTSVSDGTFDRGVDRTEVFPSQALTVRVVTHSGQSSRQSASVAETDLEILPEGSSIQKSMGARTWHRHPNSGWAIRCAAFCLGSIPPKVNCVVVLHSLRLPAGPNELTRGQWEMPSVRRLPFFFERGDGVAQIAGCELYAGDGINHLESDDAELLLETRIPADGTRKDGARIAIGLLLDGAVLTLLDALHPGWAAGEGSEGQVDIRWHRKPDGGVRTVVGGVVAYRRIATTTRSFWDRGDASPSRRADTAG